MSLKKKLKMINFDSLTLKFFLRENLDFLNGAYIQKIQQPTRKDLILTLRNLGETRKLYININPEIYHICFLTDEFKDRRHIEIPQAPPMFCMLLRKYLEGSKIKRVSIPEHERIFEVFTEFYNELSEKSELCLAVELMGKHSNIILYNSDTNVILGCAHNVGSEKSRERELAGGFPYIYPKLTSKKEFCVDYDNNSVSGNLTDYYYISNALENQFKNNCTDFSDIKNLLSGNVHPCISVDYGEYSLLQIKNFINRNNVNIMLDDYYSYHIEQRLIKNLKSQISAKINKEYKKLKTLLVKQNEELQKGEKANAYRKKADLLMANIYNLKTYSNKVILKDFENDEEILIDIDETKSIVDNANKYYKLYNKAKNAFNIISERILTTKKELEKLDEDIFFLTVSETLNDLEEIKDNYFEEKVVKKKKELLVTSLEINGFTVFIGKNNKQNDYIYSKIAKSDDIWLHALNATGSHILIKRKNDEIIGDDTLLECAKIAKAYSTAKNENKARIIYTERKNLKRPPNTPMGYVTYKNEKEIIV